MTKYGQWVYPAVCNTRQTIILQDRIEWDIVVFEAIPEVILSNLELQSLLQVLYENA